MRYVALAADYDGTLATHGSVGSGKLSALERLLATGRKLVLVTGRELDDLSAITLSKSPTWGKTRSSLHVAPAPPRRHSAGTAVSRDVAVVIGRERDENGALLYRPATRETQRLAEPPPALLDDVGLTDADPEEVLRASFGFLLEREPVTSILPKFSLDDIPRFFLDYYDELEARLR